MIWDYLFHLKQQGLSMSSIKVHLAAISAFHPGVEGVDCWSVFANPLTGQSCYRKDVSESPVLSVDVTDPNSIKAAVQRVEEHVKGHGLNLLINNAGIARMTTMENENAETMAIVYLTNTVGPLLVSQEFLPLLKKAAQQSTQTGLSCRKAAIVNMSSTAASIALVTSWELLPDPSYRCSKAALNMITRCQSLEYKDYGILCTSIHPGWVKTRMGTEKPEQGHATGSRLGGEGASRCPRESGVSKQRSGPSSEAGAGPRYWLPPLSRCQRPLPRRSR
ncbi:uncharacterized protein LOC128848980 [Malaclemys terrapin pileata]|uniref:uncharacterized protein LOC128848980 n=1 Tax=Malaclemys terrapin pileata TaxID=2991368 RepID=UPI0023A8437D|nr:uncharacterized protein LOC128848980 [Malaclemys terrapin pileata]